MKKLAILILSFVFSMAHAVEFDYDRGISSADRGVLQKAFSEAMEMVPQKFKEGLPVRIKISVRDLSGGAEMPTNVCDLKTDDGKADTKTKFRYGEYSYLFKSLTLNSYLVKELAKGRLGSAQISCQHKTLYDQSIATIIHELTHAYDSNSPKKVSKDSDFVYVAGFKKTLFGTRKRNKDPMRSVDAYELKNLEEAFAVNMEYFVTDPEFQCRKPVTFEFYKKHFGIDPFPNRKCKVNETVLVSTNLGTVPAELKLDRVYRIDYLHAHSGKDIESRFGHSMFRIVTCAPAYQDVRTQRMIPATVYGRDCLKDAEFHMIVSFRANQDDFVTSYIKGLTGGYPSMLFILGYPEVIDGYTEGEMRDIVSYPMKLSEEEKKDFILGVLEEHWNYRGAYWFLTNNCAVESQSLINNLLSNRKAAQNLKDPVLPRLTPKSMLDELVRVGLIDENDPELEKRISNLKSLSVAYEVGFGKKFSSEKKAKKAIEEFVKESSLEFRQQALANLRSESYSSPDSLTTLRNLKDHLNRSSALSLIEQQVVRSYTRVLEKDIAELTEKARDGKGMDDMPEVKDFLVKAQSSLLVMSDVIKSEGYGIPLKSEMKPVAELQEKANSLEKTLKLYDGIQHKIIPKQAAKFDSLVKHLQAINAHSAQLNKQFRTLLNTYLKEKIEALSRDQMTREILGRALSTDEAMLELRKLLGADVVTVKQITDYKIRTEIQNLRLFADY